MEHDVGLLEQVRAHLGAKQRLIDGKRLHLLAGPVVHGQFDHRSEACVQDRPQPHKVLGGGGQRKDEEVVFAGGQHKPPGHGLAGGPRRTLDIEPLTGRADHQRTRVPRLFTGLHLVLRLDLDRSEACVKDRPQPPEVLGGGGIASLRQDPQGKAYAQMLLDFPVRVPKSLLET